VVPEKKKGKPQEPGDWIDYVQAIDEKLMKRMCKLTETSSDEAIQPASMRSVDVSIHWPNDRGDTHKIVFAKNIHHVAHDCLKGIVPATVAQQRTTKADGTFFEREVRLKPENFKHMDETSDEEGLQF